MRKKLVDIFYGVVNKFYIWRSNRHLAKAVNDLSRQLAGLEEVSNDRYLRLNMRDFSTLKEKIGEMNSEEIAWSKIAEVVKKMVKDKPELVALRKNLDEISKAAEALESMHNKASIEIGPEGQTFTPGEFVKQICEFRMQSDFCRGLYRRPPRLARRRVRVI